MFASDFAIRLKKLNPHLRIYCGDDKSRPASLYHIVNNEEETICGIDKSEVPERPIYDEQGHILKSGWIRVLNILIKKGFTSKKRAEKIFTCHLYNTPQPPLSKPKYKNIDEYHPDDLREIGSKVNASN